MRCIRLTTVVHILADTIGTPTTKQHFHCFSKNYPAHTIRCTIYVLYRALISTYYTIYNKKKFLERQLVLVLIWRAQKMRSATSSKGPQLVRIAVPCAQKKGGWPWRCILEQMA